MALGDSRRLVSLLIIFLLPPSLLGQQTTAHEQPEWLVVVPAASNIERFYGRFWFSEGCYRLKYNVTAPYPGSTALKSISDELKHQGWVRQADLGGKPVSMHGVTKRFGVWERWKSTLGKTYLRTEQWRTQAGDVVNYSLWYCTPDMKSLQVEAEYCSAAFVKKRECLPGTAIAHEEKAYSIAMNIKGIEPTKADFKISVEIENKGEKPVLLGVNGELSDGSPELWVLGGGTGGNGWGVGQC